MSGERGSVSVVAAALVAALLVLSMGVADLVRVLAAAARAQTAADAAALAAAQELAVPSGDAEPAELAGALAARNGAALASCRCDPGTFEAQVAVSVPVGPLLLLADDRVVVARALAVVDLPGG